MESWNTYKTRRNPLNNEPGGLLRWGTTFLGLFFLLIIIFAALVPFNQVVKGTVTITSKNPPAEIKVKRAGKLAAINFQSGDSIAVGDVIAVLENTGTFSDIVYLKQELMKDVSEISSFESLVTEFPAYLKLGPSVQPAYNKFLEEYQEKILQNSFNEDKAMEVQVQDNIRNQASILKYKEEELLLIKNALAVSLRNMERHRNLYSKGVISQAELEKVELEHAEKNRQYVLLKQQILQLNADKGRATSNLEILQHSGSRKINKNKTNFVFAKQNLQNSIEEWEDEYAIKSPIDGKLTYNEVWNENQNVEEGEVVFTVVPYSKNKFLGKCIVPVKNAGQIRNGQQVYLKLDNYPSTEWGIVKAKVNSVSQVPSRGLAPSYVIYLDVENLSTSYGKELVLSQELIGTAEILLERVTLLERIFYQFRHIWAT
ncbi:HlyD family secretion protein [Zunongwangia sp. H14]|uniref:HlyD family secretion protein n=1 Tax=Zunongwangia sp. H14 TaxID=3240792 RepID=UPI0035685496